MELPYKCCKHRSVKVYVCIQCGAVFHKSCIEKQKDVVIIDETRVKCCVSVDENIASVIENKLRSELALLERLVDEMEKRNALLEEKIEHLELIPGGKRENMSYAAVLAREKNVSPIVVKPIKQTAKGEILRQIKSAVKLNDLQIQVDTLKETKNGSLIIKCNNSENKETMKKEIEKIKNLNCEIKTFDLKKPRIKIIDVIDGTDQEDIANMIITQNFKDCQKEDVKVVYIKTNKRNETKTVYAELKPKLFQKIMNENHVYIGWQRCRCFEDFNLSRCFHCNGYGHSSKNCRNELSCQYCAGKHDGRSCPNKSEKQCVNCLTANEKYKTDKDVKHYAFEEAKCETFAFMKKRAIANTKYC